MKEAYKASLVTSDTVVLTGMGAIRQVTFACNDAAPTAGQIDIYDGVSSSGTKIYSENFTTTPFRAYTVFINREIVNGIFVDFTTTNDVNVVVTYD